MSKPDTRTASDATGSKSDATPAVRYCLNCEEELAGRFCANCGQDHRDARLSMRALFSHFIEGFTDFDPPIWRTVICLTIRPGVICRTYVEGKRKRLANPVKYFLITGALWVLVLSAFVDSATQGFERLSMMLGTNIEISQVEVGLIPKDASAIGGANVEASASVPVTADGEDESTPAAAGAQQVMKHIKDVSSRVPAYSNWLVALSVPFMALLLWVLFYRHRLRIAEHAVLCLYGFGHLFLFTSPLAVLGLMGTAIGSLVLSLIPIVYMAWAARDFYQVGWFNAIWKMVLIRVAQMLTVGILVILTVAIIVTWRMMTE